MILTEACIKKPVLAWMIMGATVVFGGVAATRIGISQFPDVDFPTINVNVDWEGAAPEVVENDVVELLEEALVQVEGVRALTSTSRQGGASITVELDLERDVDLALQDVQARVAQAQRQLPLDIEPPVISKTNPEDQPILWLGLSGPFSQQVLSDYARYRVKDRLQTVPGVGEIMMGGFVERNVRIWVDAGALDERGLTVDDVMARSGASTSSCRRDGSRAKGARSTCASWARRSTSTRCAGSSSTIRAAPRCDLEDVALVEDGFEDVRRLARVNGAPAQGIGIRKQRGANAVAVADGVRTAMAEIKRRFRRGWSWASTSTRRSSSRTRCARSSSSSCCRSS